MVRSRLELMSSQTSGSKMNVRQQRQLQALIAELEALGYETKALLDPEVGQKMIELAAAMVQVLNPPVSHSSFKLRDDV